jgi:DNA-binding NarL/FixJ family response regulator
VLRLAIVDDHPVARRGLISILEVLGGVQVAAAVPGGEDIPRDETGRPDADLIVLDLYLADGNPALELITELSAWVPVLVVSASRTPADVLAAVQAGASGFLTKQADEADYGAAIEAVAAGKFYLSAQLADLLDLATRDLPPHRASLSPREQEVLGLIARGLTHHQVARRTGVAKATVDTYVARIRAKLGLGNKAELALAALRFIPPAG